MKKLYLFFKLTFFSVFATTKMLSNVENEIADLWGTNEPKSSAKNASDTDQQ